MWKFFGYEVDENQEITGSVWDYLIDDIPHARKIIPIWEDPKDRSVHNGITYILKPPTWETKMDEWFAEQKELEKTFDSPEEYARYISSVVSLSE